MNQQILSSGNILLDNILPNKGFKKGECSLILGKANIGTSVFLISLACNMLREGKKVLYIDIENARDLALKITSNLSQIKYGQINHNTIANLNLKERYLCNLDIVHPKMGTNIEDIIEYCESKKGYDVIMIDYVQLLQSRDKQNMIHQNKLRTFILESLNHLSKRLDNVIVSPFKTSYLFNKDKSFKVEPEVLRQVSSSVCIERHEIDLKISMLKPSNGNFCIINPNIELFDFLPYNPNYAKKLQNMFDKEL
jgi:archaellum biogenesis ATPase FlaH